ncbi:MAG: RagB/SusD family nutrient uptake outer membrane protein, partial [Bacteroidota bacterium]|nr:RagB/SusD family nutrient uptake outer membrane protein [Bacteroidota bacterium]
MKAKVSILLLPILLLASSCSDFLDIRTEATMPSSGMDYSKTENIFLPVSAAYASMRLGESEALNYMALLEIVSDDADKGSAPDDGPAVKEFDEFTYGPENEHIGYVWGIFYRMVSAANYAVESMDMFAEAVSSEEALRQVAECRAESRLIRAFAYFNLVRLFGTVPLIDRTMSSEELASMPASTPAQVYDFIYKDLDVAIATLPASHADMPGRYTSYTARALKAKVALYNKDWNEAASQADAIMASGNFSLMPKFRDAFSVEHENGPESLMEIQSSDMGQTSGAMPICYYGFIQGPRN